MGIGENIKNLRKRKAMSQQALCKLAGIGQGQLSEYERDLATPKIDILSRIADALQVSVAVLDRRLLIPSAIQTKTAKKDGNEAIREVIIAKLDDLSGSELGKIYSFIEEIFEKRKGQEKNV